MAKKTISGELLEVLLESRSNESVSRFIIASVCKEYDITFDELIKSNMHYDSLRVEASSIISYLLYTHCKLTQVQIGMLLKKDNSVISKYLKRINLLNEKFQPDFVISKRIKSFDEIIKNYKSST